MAPRRALHVSLLPTLSAHAGASMSLYSRDLEAALRGLSGIEPHLAKPPLGGENETGALRRRWSQYVGYPRWCRSVHDDLYHVTDHANAQLLLTLPRRRTVVTCHDLFPIAIALGKVRFAGAPTRFEMTPTALRLQLLRRAAAVVAISDHTLRECREYLGIPPQRLFRARYGVSEVFKPAPSSQARSRFRVRHGIPENGVAVLHVGSNDPRKNLRGVLRTVAALPEQQGERARLVKVGPRFRAQENEWIASLGLARSVIELGPLVEDQVVEAYWGCDVLLYPSYHEGFCRPVSEAMACGLPVVASNRGAIPEVLSGAGRMKDPEDIAGLAQAVRELAGSADAREELKQRGLDRARGFTWRAHAEAVAQAYRAVAARWI